MIAPAYAAAIKDITNTIDNLTLDSKERTQSEKLVAEFAKIKFDHAPAGSLHTLGWKKYLRQILPVIERAYVNENHYLDQAQWRVDKFSAHYPLLSKNPDNFCKIQLVALTLTIKSLEERKKTLPVKIPFALEMAFLTTCDFKIPKLSLVQEIEHLCFKEPTVDFDQLSQALPGTYLIQKTADRQYFLFVVQKSPVLLSYEFNIDENENVVLLRDGKTYSDYSLFLSTHYALYEVTDFQNLQRQIRKNDPLKSLLHDLEKALCEEKQPDLMVLQEPLEEFLERNPNATFQHYLEVNPNLPLACKALGSHLCAKRKYAKAEKYLKLFFHSLDLKLVNCSLEPGKFQRARLHLREFQDKHSCKIENSYRELFDCQFEQGNFVDVEKTIRLVTLSMHTFDDSSTLLKHNSKLAEFFEHFAQMLLEKDKVNLALVYLDKAVRYAPASHDGLLTREQCLKKQRENQSAEAYIKRVVRRHPKPNLVEEDLRRALEINPQSEVALENLGACLRQLRRVQEAVGYLTQALELNVHSVFAHTELGACLYQSNKYKEAIKCFERALKLNQNCITARQGLGASLLRLGRYSDAEKHLRRALKLDPHSGFTREKLVESLELQCKFHEARDYLYKTVECDFNGVELEVCLR